jgi:hypothetical protein
MIGLIFRLLLLRRMWQILRGTNQKQDRRQSPYAKP